MEDLQHGHVLTIARELHCTLRYCTETNVMISSQLKRRKVSIWQSRKARQRSPIVRTRPRPYDNTRVHHRAQGQMSEQSMLRDIRSPRPPAFLKSALKEWIGGSVDFMSEVTERESGGKSRREAIRTMGTFGVPSAD